MGMNAKRLLEIVLCFFLPPLAVFIHSGYEIGSSLLISILLTVLAWIPGIIFALWYCLFRGGTAI